jgi:imidazolonepropionase-like amidohydrolase
MKSPIVFILLLCMILCGCTQPAVYQTPTTEDGAVLVLTNGILIDGTGAEPIPNATLVIDGDRILAAGASGEVAIPAGARVVDLGGATILPGFINAHVHDAFDEERLKAWAQAGVTTVREEGILSSPSQITEKLELRNKLAGSSQYARLITAGYMISVPGGYGQLDVTSAEDAEKQVNMELEAGVDLIKLAVEDGYGQANNLPLLSADELAAVVATAHRSGVWVSAHVTDAKYLQQVVDAGVDDAAHIPWDVIAPELVQQMVSQGTYAVTTLTVMDAYGAAQGATRNLGLLHSAGVMIAMGNDYTRVPQNGFDHFELGMPMHELNLMQAAGLSNMEIIVASTRNAAHVCGLGAELGTLESGKLADVLVVSGNPLEDLSALTQVRMVIHSGEVIRDGGLR